MGHNEFTVHVRSRRRCAIAVEMEARVGEQMSACAFPCSGRPPDAREGPGGGVDPSHEAVRARAQRVSIGSKHERSGERDKTRWDTADQKLSISAGPFKPA